VDDQRRAARRIVEHEDDEFQDAHVPVVPEEQPPNSEPGYVRTNSSTTWSATNSTCDAAASEAA
jgi:hypothetical protein